MRTLKKVLALTIALATLFSLTAFAAYKDESAIASETMSAVNLVNSLKIMTGDTKGNFNPTATITRAEAAKMVYVVRTGGNTNAEGWKGQNVFTDTKGHWAEGFINYCASVGIIAGVGNGKFNPEGKLTGVELAKMLLVAAGYKADIQGYTGSAWQTKVLADAENAGLFNNYAPAYVGAAPRQYAAVMFSNCLLKTNMAVYLSGELVNGAIGNQILVGEKYFGLATKTGIITNISDNTFDLDATPVSFKGANVDLAHQSVTVVYKKAAGGAIDTVYDVYASGKSKVYNVGNDDVSLKEVTAATEYTLELPGYAKTTYTGTALTVNLYQTSNSFTTAKYNTLQTIRTNVTTKTTNDALRFIDQTGDGKIDVIIWTDAKYDLVAANKPADGTFTLTNSTAGFGATKAAEYNALVFADTVEKGDVVKLTTNMAGKKVIEKVEAAKGVATMKDGTDYVIGGVAYSKADTVVGSYAFDNIVLGKEFYVYTDGVYVVYATPVVAAAVTEYSDNIALAIAVKDGSDDGFTSSTSKVKVLLATGETKIFDYTDLDGDSGSVYLKYSDLKTAIAAVAKVYQYTLKDGKISLRAVADPSDNNGYTFDQAADTTVTFSKSTKIFTYASAGAVRTNDKSYAFVKYTKDSADAYAVVKANEFNTFGASDFTTPANGGKYLASMMKNGIKTMAFAYIDFADKSLPGSGPASTYAIVTGTVLVELDADGEEIFTQTVTYLDGTAGKIQIADELTEYARGLYKVSTASTGISTLTAATTDAGKFVTSVTLSGFGDGYVLDSAGKFVDLASTAKIFFLSKDAEGGYKVNGIVPNDKAEYQLNSAMSYKLNSDGEITALVIVYDVVTP